MSSLDDNMICHLVKPGTRTFSLIEFLNFGCIFLLVGTTKIKNLDDNIASLKVKLNPEDMKEISDSVPEHEVAGLSTYASMDKWSWKYAITPSKS